MTIALVLIAFLLFSRKGVAANPASSTAARPGSTAGNARSSGGGSAGAGGAAPAGAGRGGGSPLSAIESFFNFTAPGGSVIPQVGTGDETLPAPDFWATPPAADLPAELAFTSADGSNVAFGGDPSLQLDDNGLVIDPDTGLPFGQASTDTATPGGFFDTAFGPDPPPDDFVDTGDFSI